MTMIFTVLPRVPAWWSCCYVLCSQNKQNKLFWNHAPSWNCLFSRMEKLKGVKDSVPFWKGLTTTILFGCQGKIKKKKNSNQKCSSQKSSLIGFCVVFFGKYCCADLACSLTLLDLYLKFLHAEQIPWKLIHSDTVGRHSCLFTVETEPFL